jgi:hypothetical protein
MCTPTLGEAISSGRRAFIQQESETSLAIMRIPARVRSSKSSRISGR